MSVPPNGTPKPRARHGNPFTRRLDRIRARLLGRRELQVRSHRAIIVDLVIPFLNRLEIVDRKGPLPLDRLLYRIYWWIVFFAVVFLPTWPGESTLYSLALVALIGGWLIAAPQLTQVVTSADYRVLKPGPGTTHRFLAALRRVHVDFPAVNPTEEREIDDWLTRMTSRIIPLFLVRLVFRLGVRALVLLIIAVAGFFIGPALATVHGPRGWSPVSLLYAVTVPDVLMMLTSLLLPVMAHTIINAIKVDQEAPPAATDIEAPSGDVAPLPSDAGS